MKFYPLKTRITKEAYDEKNRENFLDLKVYAVYNTFFK